MRFSAPAGREVPPKVESSGGPFFRYTEEDDRQFQKLAGLATPKRNVSTPAGHGGRYTKTDRELFDRLSPAPRDAAAAAVRVSPAPKAAAEPVRYSDRDLEAFRRLMPGEAQDDQPAHPAKTAQRDRDVGPIRIVDADLERERERRNRNRRDPRVKVRFFE